ncbi:unnamed protein product [Vicia faba]|uniref:Uncharacterized protein n=1 Tax=Vicia faba TaxID=3906 RepID=A0AAV1A6S6_VICFA|nr:unnamed protein product [Vicia faba]
MTEVLTADCKVCWKIEDDESLLNSRKLLVLYNDLKLLAKSVLQNWDCEGTGADGVCGLFAVEGEERLCTGGVRWLGVNSGGLMEEGEVWSSYCAWREGVCGGMNRGDGIIDEDEVDGNGGSMCGNEGN